ncbi:MAG: LysR family transcriptional regulator [Granulosicoccus sp.]
MLRNLDIATLRTFVSVVETAGVTRAANKLHLTQSAVSMQLKRLEEMLGVTLFKRDSHGMHPTPAGEQLLSNARRLVALNDATLSEITQRSEGGEVRFGVSPDIVEPHVTGILKQFVQQYPRASVRLFCKHSLKLLERFRAGKLDVIITTELNTNSSCKNLVKRDLVWTGAIQGTAWRLDPLPLAFTRISAFKEPAIAALDAAGISWINAVDSGNNLESGAIVCAADLAIRADIHGFRAAGMAEVVDNDNRLPKLPSYFVNLYKAEGAGNDKLIEKFSKLVESAFTSEQEEDSSGE